MNRHTITIAFLRSIPKRKRNQSTGVKIFFLCFKKTEIKKQPTERDETFSCYNKTEMQLRIRG